MSDFVAGFSSRHAGVGAALARAFTSVDGFAATEMAPAPPPRHFSPQSAGPRHFHPADRDTNPTEGWNPFDAEAAATPPPPAVDPVAAARAAGYAEGLAAGRAEAQAAGDRDRLLVDRLGIAMAGAAHVDRDGMARRLRQTVMALVTRLVGEAGVSADRLAGRIEAAVELLADKAESALLRLHPDDIPLVAERLPKNVFAVGDAQIERGGFILESASTIVEDGPGLWLDQLGQAIERTAVPPIC